MTFEKLAFLLRFSIFLYGSEGFFLAFLKKVCFAFYIFSGCIDWVVRVRLPGEVVLQGFLVEEVF